MSLAPLTPRRVFLWMKIAALVGIALLFVVLYKFGQQNESKPTVLLKKPQFSSSATYRKNLPVFEWDNNRGQTLGAKDFKGHWTLLNFWAHWCYPCHAELPLLKAALNKELANPNLGLRVILVNTDKDNTDHQKLAEEFVLLHGLNQLNLFDPFALLSQSFEVKEYPFHILVNPKGEIVYADSGAIDWQAPEVLESLIKLLQTEPVEARAASPSKSE